MINNNMLNGVARAISGSSYTIPSYLAFGSTTGTVSAADTVCSGEFDRNALTSTTRSNSLVKYVSSRLSTEAAGQTINNLCLVNSSTLGSSGNIQANVLIASLVHTSDRKSTRLNSSHVSESRMPSSA